MEQVSGPQNNHHRDTEEADEYDHTNPNVNNRSEAEERDDDIDDREEDDEEYGDEDEDVEYREDDSNNNPDGEQLDDDRNNDDNNLARGSMPNENETIGLTHNDGQTAENHSIPIGGGSGGGGGGAGGSGRGGGGGSGGGGNADQMKNSPSDEEFYGGGPSTGENRVQQTKIATRNVVASGYEQEIIDFQAILSMIPAIGENLPNK